MAIKMERDISILRFNVKDFSVCVNYSIKCLQTCGKAAKQHSGLKFMVKYQCKTKFPYIIQSNRIDFHKNNFIASKNRQTKRNQITNVHNTHYNNLILIIHRTAETDPSQHNKHLRAEPIINPLRSNQYEENKRCVKTSRAKYSMKIMNYTYDQVYS